jgi:hypothetical protein
MNPLDFVMLGMLIGFLVSFCYIVYDENKKSKERK